MSQLHLPEDMGREMQARMAMAQARSEMASNMHIQCSMGVYARLIHRTSNQKDLLAAAEQAILAADVWLAQYGMALRKSSKNQPPPTVVEEHK